MASCAAAAAAAVAAASSSPSRSYSGLPRDLLIRIVSLQTFLVDLFRFRAVCRSWRSAAHAAAAQNLLPRLPSPFLMSPDDADPLTWLFYCVREGKLHRLRFPDDSSGWRCCGSSHGWFAMLGSRADALLFQPFSGSRAEVPPLTTLPGVRRLEPAAGGGDGPKFLVETPWNNRGGMMVITVGAEVLRDVHVEKAVLAMDPSSDTVPAVVVLLLHDFGGLVYARPGDEVWKVLPTTGVDSLRDVVYHGGLFYGLSYEQDMVFTIDLFSGDRPTLQRFPVYYESTFYGSSYLAVVPSGVILHVRRGTRRGPGASKTESFQVLRLNMEEPKKWVKVKALRGISLFLDASCSTALYSSRVSGKCRGNCIYFADDDRYPGYVCDRRVSDGDFGLFRMEDKAVERGFPAGAEVTMKRPVWVMLSN